MAICSYLRCGCAASDSGVLRPVMGGWPPPRAPSLYHIGLYFLTAILLVSPVVMEGCDKCGINACTRSYHTQVDMGGVERAATPQYCAILLSYSNCLRATARSCRGCIDYHSNVLGVNRLYEKFHCASLPTDTSEHVNPSPGYSPPSCSYRIPKGNELDFHYCGVWGDPHILRFDESLETCGVRGAWPLIDNNYLVVQLTNRPAINGPQTIVSKLTVIIKEDSGCTQQLTYEAGNGSLPAAFVDGNAGQASTVILREHDPGRHVELFLRHIRTTIEIRDLRTGGLSFAVRMPQVIARQGDNKLALCSRGCPSSEHLLEPVTERMSEGRAVRQCTRHGLKEHFLDACVFDLIATGDEAFAVAAKLAQKDYTNLMPKSKLSNRTVWRGPTERYRSSAVHPTVSWWCLLVLLTMLTVGR